jgi:VIT1/CCC1 family predicted Fe2+/Mn2+ transporter
VREAIRAHLDSPQVARVVYGSIIGLALVAALEAHPPGAGFMVGALLATAVAVALAELYSDILGGEVRARRRLARAEVRHMAVDASAVAFGIAFPAVFFVLAAAGAMEEHTAFTVAKWSGLGLIGIYGFVASRLGGQTPAASLLRGAGIALVGAFLIAMKALLH